MTQKSLYWAYTCTPKFTEVLFTVANTQKQPRCHQQLNKGDVVYIYDGIYSTIKEMNLSQFQ